MDKTSAVILVGHGAAPADYPRERLQRLKRLEAERTTRRQTELSVEEAALDREIRAWPRTPETDAYKSGLETLARALESRCGRKVVTAYNEFCGPSLEQAVLALCASGVTDIAVATTMFTRGGVHSDCEIPFAVQELQKRFPRLRLRYAWPFDTERIADFLARHLEAA